MLQTAAVIENRGLKSWTQASIAKAVQRQMANISYVYSGSPYMNSAVEDLASLVLADSPGGLSKAIFVSSGSEATDAAPKLAAQYWAEVGKPGRCNIISRHQSYHGNTLGSLGISGNETRRAIYKPWPATNVHFVDPCYTFRAKLDHEDDAAYVLRLMNQLEDKILEVGPETVAAFVAETISGSSLGCVPAVPGYFPAVRALCDKYGILLILDEVGTIQLEALSKCDCVAKAYLYVDRSCVEWARRAPCTPGSRRV